MNSNSKSKNKNKSNEKTISNSSPPNNSNFSADTLREILKLKIQHGLPNPQKLSSKQIDGMTLEELKYADENMKIHSQLPFIIQNAKKLFLTLSKSIESLGNVKMFQELIGFKCNCIIGQYENGCECNPLKSLTAANTELFDTDASFKMAFDTLAIENYKFLNFSPALIILQCIGTQAYATYQKNMKVLSLEKNDTIE